jgi:hypothetical protein
VEPTSDSEWYMQTLKRAACVRHSCKTALNGVNLCCSIAASGCGVGFARLAKHVAKPKLVMPLAD